MHSALPAEGWYVPTLQYEQLPGCVEPLLGWKRPIAQLLQLL
jgi:hypothetical protein